jgi:hypothetical protein
MRHTVQLVAQQLRNQPVVTGGAVIRCNGRPAGEESGGLRVLRGAESEQDWMFGTELVLQAQQWCGADPAANQERTGARFGRPPADAERPDQVEAFSGEAGGEV